MGMRNPANHPMPEIAAFVAALKSAFGEREIDEAIRRGKAGEPTFYAFENGRMVGTASTSVVHAAAHDREGAKHTGSHQGKEIGQ